MLKINRDFYEGQRGETIYEWSTVVNGKELVYRTVIGRIERHVPIRMLETTARRAFADKIFEGSFRE
jgi:hypothetical protein